MGKVTVRGFSSADEVVRYPLGENRQVSLGGSVISYDIHRPGWTWTDHVRPIVGADSCQFYHRGYVLRGRMGVRTDEGEEVIVESGQVFDITPGHVGWVEGDEELVTLDWAGGAEWASPPVEGERVVATLLFTDVVASTRLARELGDTAWRRRLALHDETVRALVSNYRGREIETAGDSFLIVFDGAARAVRCAVALVDALAAIEVPIRAGVHTGEVIPSGSHLRGVALHAAARIVALAGAGEVMVSSTTRELAEGSDLAFESRGRHRLKGLDDEREVFAIVR